jgi:coproporphyrinogen III oxidase-like Fe-S oxidoreductase
MGLRLVEGVDLARLEALAGCATDHGLDPAALEQLVADGLLAVHGGRLAATAAGRERLDALLAAIVR